jgi:23S rRNA (cytosine1962-C5)-methyltransferase
MTPTAMARVVLKPGREKSLRRLHPWVFSGAVERVEGAAENGATVEVVGSSGEFLAYAAYSKESQIRLRAWSFERGEVIDAAFFRRRLERAIEGRRRLGLLKPDGACRLVFSESDGIPGLIVDRYGSFLVCQFLAVGVERSRDLLVDELAGLLSPTGIYERSESAARRKEGLPSRQQTLYGEAPPPLVTFQPDAARLVADIAHGQKTGAYLDQQRNRCRLARFAAGARLLDAFAFSGAFSAECLVNGADSAVLIDSSSEALRLTVETLRLNDLADRCEFRQADVFSELRALSEAGEDFDIVVLDPPKFVHSAPQLAAGARGYKDINRLAAGLVRRGGLLATFSCSGHVDAALFQKIVAGAMLDAGCSAQIIEWFDQPGDHPVALAFPESAYLKGLLLRVW